MFCSLLVSFMVLVYIERDVIMEISVYLFLLFYVIVKSRRMQDGTRQNALLFPSISFHFIEP